MQAAQGSIRPEEVAKFGRLAARWWDETGPLRPLHLMNPLRAAWIVQRIGRHFGGCAGVQLLDIGCGAGLLSEALARAGCDVLGVDASGEAIAAARAHAAGQNLSLAYAEGSAETLAGRKFAVVTALEIIEHVADPAGFIASLTACLSPGGLLFVSTINRTSRAWLSTKLGAEYLLRLLPAGTHDWRQYVSPNELAGFCRASGLHFADIAGIEFAPLAGGFRIGRDTRVNYIAMARR